MSIINVNNTRMLIHVWKTALEGFKLSKVVLTTQKYWGKGVAQNIKNSIICCNSGMLYSITKGSVWWRAVTHLFVHLLFQGRIWCRDQVNSDKETIYWDKRLSSVSQMCCLTDWNDIPSAFCCLRHNSPKILRQQIKYQQNLHQPKRQTPPPTPETLQESSSLRIMVPEQDPSCFNHINVLKLNVGLYLDDGVLDGLRGPLDKQMKANTVATAAVLWRPDKTMLQVLKKKKNPTAHFVFPLFLCLQILPRVCVFIW